MLTKIERLLPGILDFTAMTVARRFLAESGERDLSETLSIAECRKIFDAAKPATRAVLVAGLVGSPPDTLVGAARLGDNLMRAMLDRFRDEYGAEFGAFGDRRRR